MKKTTSPTKPTHFIDTNIFLRTLVREDERSHQACVKYLETVRNGKVWATTSPLVLAEVVWTLKSYYGLSKPEVVTAAESITQLRHLRVVAHEQVAVGLRLFSEYNVKFIDALIASTPAILTGATPVVSYDKDFDKLDGVCRVEPDALT